MDPARQVTVAVDAMGGDYAPEEVVRGVAQLSLEAPYIQTVLVGDGAQLAPLLAQVRHGPDPISVRHEDARIYMQEKAAEALCERPQASIAVAAQLVAQGAADALVSAGNTGASVLACAQSFRAIPGVRRAALASVY